MIAMGLRKVSETTLFLLIQVESYVTLFFIPVDYFTYYVHPQIQQNRAGPVALPVTVAVKIPTSISKCTPRPAQ